MLQLHLVISIITVLAGKYRFSCHCYDSSQSGDDCYAVVFRDFSVIIVAPSIIVFFIPSNLRAVVLQLAKSC